MVYRCGSVDDSSDSIPLQALSHEEKLEVAKSNYNFDHPAAFDIDLIVHTLAQLKSGKMVEIPTYDFTTHSRTSQTVIISLIRIFIGR